MVYTKGNDSSTPNSIPYTILLEYDCVPPYTVKHAGSVPYTTTTTLYSQHSVENVIANFTKKVNLISN